jgi:lipoprotein NlpD
LPAPVGTPVFAAADGEVAYAGSGVRGYGNMLVIRHAGDLLTVYAHNSVLLVARGQPVRAGDRIALVGQSGHATGPHLHFEVRAGEIPRDPMLFLPEVPR